MGTEMASIFSAAKCDQYNFYISSKTDTNSSFGSFLALVEFPNRNVLSFMLACCKFVALVIRIEHVTRLILV